VQKGGSWEKIRVIHHLSHPFGGDSINANIEPEPLELGRFDAACDAIRLLGCGCLLCKFDVEAAYKQVPVRPGDRPLLGIKWRGKYYYELCLPFGLRSSGYRWELFAAALHWFFRNILGIELVIHYVDDFLIVLPATPAAARLRDLVLRLCEWLGIPMSPAKTEGPTTRLTFLGIELDTVALTARLDDKRLAELAALLADWVGRETCSIRELQSLCGKLHFASSVVRAGRVFVRRLVDLTSALERQGLPPGKPHTLTAPARADIRWWQRFIREWNGKSLLYEREWTRADALHLYTDACTQGYGAAHGSRWYQGRWPASVWALAQRDERESMPFLELYALVQAARTFGAALTGRKVYFHCDCEPACFVVQHSMSRSKEMQALLRELHMTAARRGFDVRVMHIAGVTNTVADALSRQCTREELLALLPTAEAEPTSPAAMPDDLMLDM
jgi:hypothetical protein